MAQAPVALLIKGEDEVAINKALETAEVVVLGGFHNINGTINVPGDTHLFGLPGTVVNCQGNFHGIFASPGYEANITVSGIEVRGGDYGIIARGTNVNILNCTSKNAARQGIVAHGDGNKLIRISGCKVANSGQSGVSIMGYTDGGIIENCEAVNSGIDGFTGYDQRNKNIIWQNCTSTGTGNHGTHIAGDNVTMANCLFDGTAAHGSGIYVAPHNGVRNSNIKLIDCVVKDSGKDGIFVKYNDGGSIEGCVVVDSNQHGIDVLDSTAIVVNKNFVSDPTNDGIRVDRDCRNNVISNNTLVEGRVHNQHSSNTELNNREFYV